jgi:flavin-dependent dehydrogenase
MPIPVPTLGERFDVIVAGAGSSGAIAAVATARTGARTLLIEKYGFLGGISTGVLDTFYGFYAPGTRSIKVVGGIADEVVDALRRSGNCFERPNTYGAGTGVTYNAE